MYAKAATQQITAWKTGSRFTLPVSLKSYSAITKKNKLRSDRHTANVDQIALITEDHAWVGFDVSQDLISPVV
jgi:hypothetical protein